MVKYDLAEIRRLNLIRLMKENNIIPARLAESIDRDPPYIAAILKPRKEKGHRGIGKKILALICEKTGWKEEEFYKGIGFEVPERQSRPIPVISWVSAGSFLECIDIWPVGVSGEGDPVFSVKQVSPYSFGLCVKGDSMFPRYMPGDIIIVDPTLKCDNGSPCVVWVNGDISFKYIKETDSEIVLTSMNDKYPETVIKKDRNVDFRIVGKVVDMIPKL
jgi:SOS-response transcriptional repressor LexA